MNQISIGWTTVDDPQIARQIAEELVRNGLAACVQIDGPIDSYYMWKGELKKDTEYRLSLKFASNKAAAIQRFLNEHHPYETHQWLATEATDSLPAYAEWVHSHHEKH